MSEHHIRRPWPLARQPASVGTAAGSVAGGFGSVLYAFRKAAASSADSSSRAKPLVLPATTLPTRRTPCLGGADLPLPSGLAAGASFTVLAPALATGSSSSAESSVEKRDASFFKPRTPRPRPSRHLGR